MLPGRLTRKVALIDHDDGSRQLVFLDEEPRSLPPAATVGQPKMGAKEGGGAYEKTNQSEDIRFFPRVGVVNMP